MRTDGDVGLPTITAAQAGDRRAREELAAECLPLVYNIVGRALNGHADVDDVVQETLLRVLDGLGGLREPSRFRAWLVSIAMNEVRRRWSGLMRRPSGPLEEGREVPDPTADFVEVTILRLRLSGQRKQTAQATRWLDPEDRELLALWWQESTGHLTRSELAEALALSTQHAAVRVQRMRERLEIGRVIVRSLEAEPRCTELAELAGHWDGVPSPVWRKRFARHIRDCPICARHRSGLVPAEALLAGLILLPPPPIHIPLSPLGVAHAVKGAHAAHNAGWWKNAGAGGKGLIAAGAGTGAMAMAAGALWVAGVAPGHGTPVAEPRSATTQQAQVPSLPPSPTSLSPTPTPTPKPTHSPSVTRLSATPRSTEEQVVMLVNQQRAQHGCPAVRSDPALRTAAQRHSADMASRGTLSHNGSNGSDPGSRMTSAGYSWSAWGENIAQGQSGPTSVMDAWMNSAGHRANILNCSYRAIGVGVSYGSGGPWWTQDFAAPR